MGLRWMQRRKVLLLKRRVCVMPRAARNLEMRNQELSRISMTDALTGLFNRRCFDERLAAEVQRAVATRVGLSIAMIDIDHFKRFNDEYGHPVGDACLKQVATAIRSQLPRSADFLGRYGGEEFALILPHTDAQGALIVGERIRQAVQAVKVDVGDRLVTVAVSIGVLHAVPDDGDSPLALVRRADQALYRAKHEGRNRVCLADGSAAVA